MRRIELPDLSGLTLIVAEDTDDSLDVLSTFLRACGARVMAARNGLEALAHLEATPRVDAIVTDLAMPHMDGVELVRKLRGHARERSLPAIGEAIAGVDRLDEGDGHRAALDEAGAEKPRHHLRDVCRRHHSLRQRGPEAFPARPGFVGVNRARPHAGIRVDVPLGQVFLQGWELLADGDVVSDGHGPSPRPGSASA